MNGGFFLVLGIVAWILFAFWPARVAKRKGYSFLGFFVLSLFIFFISLIIAYAMPDKKMSKQDRADDKAAEAALDREEDNA